MIISLVHLKRVTECNKIVAFGKKKEAGKLKVKKKKKTKLKKRPSEKKKKKKRA